MPKYISLLRGINVSGQKIIKMNELVALYNDVGFNNVTAYIQSGNVVFSTTKTATQKLATRIEEKIKQHYSFEVSVLVLELLTFKSIVEHNPYSIATDKDSKQLYITFLYKPSVDTTIDALDKIKLPNEEVTIANNAVYFYFAQGYGKTKMNNNFIEQKLKVIATTRNWKTCLQLLKIANTIQP